MRRIAWIATIAVLLAAVLAFAWLTITPAPGSDGGSAPFRGLDGKLPATSIRR